MANLHNNCKSKVYRALEEKMAPYEEIADIPIEPADEPMVAIQQTATLLTNQVELAMLDVTGEEIYVRKIVANMLGRVSLALTEIDAQLTLEVVYGYRHPSIQIANFNKLKDELAQEHPDWNEAKLFIETTRYRAPIEIAGHPTGSSVDVKVLNDGKAIDMGTEYRQFVPDTYVFSPFISREAWQNRQMLRGVMLGCGFAPYDGEWWHFSYGDREWASFYKKPGAIFGPLEFATIGESKS